MKIAINTLVTAALALLGAEAATQLATDSSLLVTKASAQANHNTTRSNRRKSGVAAPADTDGDGSQDQTSDTAPDNKMTAPLGDGVDIRIRKDVDPSLSGNGTYDTPQDDSGTVRIRKGVTIGVHTKNTTTSDVEQIGHVTLVRIGAPSEGESWCPPANCETFEAAETFYDENPDAELPQFLTREYQEIRRRPQPRQQRR